MKKSGLFFSYGTHILIYLEFGYDYQTKNRTEFDHCATIVSDVYVDILACDILWDGGLWPTHCLRTLESCRRTSLHGCMSD